MRENLIRTIFLTLAAGLVVAACGDSGGDGDGDADTDADTDMDADTDSDTGMNPRCDDYCSCMATNCPDEFADEAACQADCQTVPSGQAGDQSGNTVECRIYHCGAAETDAITHCPHAAGATPCS